jgi:hypothetical protein
VTVRDLRDLGSAGVHRALGCRPAGRIEANRAAMIPLPPVAPVTGWRHWWRLPRDHYVRLDANDYSVHPSAIGRRIEVIADLGSPLYKRGAPAGRGPAD